MNAVQSSVSVLVPAHNEEESLAGTIASIEKHRSLFRDMEIIVINDGSDDRTGQIARGLPVTVIEHTSTRGYGASLKDGLCAAKGDLIMIVDADGTYPLHQIPVLAAGVASLSASRTASSFPLSTASPTWSTLLPKPGSITLHCPHNPPAAMKTAKKCTDRRCQSS